MGGVQVLRKVVCVGLECFYGAIDDDGDVMGESRFWLDTECYFLSVRLQAK